MTKEFCDLEIETPKMSLKFVDAFANFMGYIKSLKEGQLFAWSDELNKFNSTIDVLENFYFSNKVAIDLNEN